ncbi:MAG: hypothetical protein CJD30_06920 [Sulfuricurvum sp. PD_MW2]|nr:MAG: hypothetical protein CJD30_06920 [Sulfuricurvum sp. PD_MW2]
MKDTIITKIIPKTHRSVLFFLLFIFFLGFFTFIALVEGLRIDKLSLGGVKVEKLYLKWDDSLHIKAAKLDLTDLKTDNTPLSLKPLSKLPDIIRMVDNWIATIYIEKIHYKSFSASLEYQKNQQGKISLLGSKNEHFIGYFDLNTTEFHFVLPAYQFNEATFSTHLDIDLTSQRLKGFITLALPQTPKMTAFFVGDTDTLSFSLQASHRFTTLKPLVSFARLEPDVVPWIAEYAKASSIQLNHLSGKFHYSNPSELLQSLKADATFFNGSYAFATGFEPIYASKIDLNFSKGKLYILPRNGTFYSLPTEQSYLTIDFSTEHTMLDAFIRTQHAKLNDPILALLKFYEIDLPIKQTLGECAVDLTLSIDLHDFNTVAKGTFTPSTSEILLDKIPLKTEGGIVHLDGTNVTFDHFIAHYGDNLASARVEGKYDATLEKGMINIDAYAVSALQGNLTLHNTNEPVHVSYIIEPKGDTLSVQPSHWNFFGEKLSLEGFSAPFDYTHASVSVNSLAFSLSNTISGSVQAVFDGMKKQTDAKLHLKQFKLGEIELQHVPLNIDIHYEDQNAHFSISNSSAWSIHQLPVLISPFDAEYKNNTIVFEDIETVLGDLFKGSFNGEYRIDEQEGTISLDNMFPISPKMVPIIDKKESLELKLNTKDDVLTISAPSLKAHFATIPKGWKISLDDISLLSNKSPLLRKYNINNGFLNLFYSGESSRYTFNGEIDYPYPLMLINDAPLSHYKFSGSHQNTTTTVRVNDRITISQTPETIHVRANNAGLNLPVLFKFLSEHSEDASHPTSNDPSPSVHMYATNSYLYLMKGRKILTDTFSAIMVDDKFDASLRYMNGTANLKIRNDLFSIEGEGFNDKFMEHLFALSDFSGGAFSFQANGKADAFDGLMRVEHTILKDYKVMNNILAFINTIPSLATFSLPNYNAKGLPVDEGYAHIAYKKGVVFVDNFTLNSPEMKIMGNGRADFNENQLEGTLTLKTDLGSALGKVPMVGYILLGDDGSLATTLSLNGKLDDPKVETAIAKEIATAPFNILKRTLVYPFLWMLDDKNTNKKSH